jgi:NAD(P)-dependent dehydrogenase (short-subunit alcohol dehydrogenase family)
MSREHSAPFDLHDERVRVAGRRGMVGGALVRRLAREGRGILTAGRTDANLRRRSDWTTALCDPAAGDIPGGGAALRGRGSLCLALDISAGSMAGAIRLNSAGPSLNEF